MSQPLVRLSRLFRLRRVLLGLLALGALVGWFLPPVLSSLLADANAATDLPPIKGANYKQAYKYSAEFLKQYSYSTSVSPKWFGKGDSFWYQYSTSKGTQWYRVNPRDATKEPLFDRVKLGAQLSELVRKPLDPTRLSITNGSINDEGTKFKFVTENLQFEYDLRAEKLVSLGKAAPPPAGPGGLNPDKKEALRELLGNDRYFALMEQLEKLENGEITFEEAALEEWLADLDMYFPEFQSVLTNIQKSLDDEPNSPQKKGGKGKGKGGVDPAQKKDPQKAGDPKVYSPNGKMYAYALNHNLYVAEEGKEDEAIKLTSDGTAQYTFSGGPGAGKGGGKGGGKGEEVAQKTGEKGKDQKTRPAVTWAKDSKSFYVTRADNRPEIKQLHLVNSVATPRPELKSYSYAMPGEQLRTTELYTYHVANKKLARVVPKWKDERYADMHWGKSPTELRFQRKDRLQRTIEFCSLNTQTGECKCLFADGFENVHVATQPKRYLDESNEMIWWSERSNWGHYYLYDGNGKLKNPITAGNFRASAIVQLDTKNRVMYFRGNAREPGENVYFNHLYSVNFDGNNLTLLDPGDGNHNSELSPSRQYVVDTYSRFDNAPVSVLRDARGNKILDLEKTDLSKLYEVGWRMPETFVVKAADGVTDLFGHMWKPFDFDPKKKYPIIAHVYPGPQTESMTHQFQATSQQQQLAQLNFIVIQVGNRGGSPLRSKNYQSHSYWNLRDYGLADKKTAIEQLAARFDFVDIERIGIYGHSGGGFMSTAALVVKPYNDFFKVAVSSSGNHDNNIYNSNWSEQYHGLKEVAGEKAAATKDDAKKGFGKGGAGKGGGKKKGGDEDFFNDPQMGKKKDDVKKDDVNKDDKKDDQKSDKKDDKKADMKDAKKDDKGGQKDEKKEKGPTHFEIRVPTNPELAANLKGHLLLVHGDMDNNVHPANTIRMVDALIKANKRFDLLIMPGQAHGYGPMQAYFNQRMWEYFAEHLLDDRPTSADLYDKKK